MDDLLCVGEYRSGVDRVGSPSVCKNVSDEMKLVVQVRHFILRYESKIFCFVSIFKILFVHDRRLGIPQRHIWVVGDN